jgi:Kef-type K+ transport system membrane component KefB
VIAATAIAFVGTIGGTVLGMLYSGYTMKQGLLVGWALNVKGDVELAVAALALQRAIITTDIFSAIIFVALVTTIVSPIVFRKMLKRHIRIVK